MKESSQKNPAYAEKLSAADFGRWSRHEVAILNMQGGGKTESIASGVFPPVPEDGVLPLRV